MAIDFKIDDTELKGLYRDILDAKKKLSNLRGVNLSAAITLQKWVIKNIESGGRLHKGTFWPPLKSSTIAARRRGSGAFVFKPLQDTGRLKGAFAPRGTKEYGEVTNNVGYAGVHEEGTSRVPQRKIWPSNQQTEEIIEPVYSKWIDRKLKKLR